MNHSLQIENLLKLALKEDVGTGDYSTLSTIDPNQQGKAILKVKQEGVLAGMDVAQKIFKLQQEDIFFDAKMADGAAMKPGDIAFEITGYTATILSCERLVLNTMQRMSGIATLTKIYTDQLKGFRTKLLDTRKTTPNFRCFEKEAVKIGGAYNHRFGLYDMIMLKDNHIDYCGGIVKAIEKAYQYVQNHQLNIKIEVETRNLNDVKLALSTGKVDRIMLDNFTPAQITAALTLIAGSVETEASGGINLQNLKEYAATGVDYISSGAIIHQAVSVDLSLKAVTL